MRKLIVTEYLTLDGVFEAPNTWSFPFWNDEAAAFKHKELFASDALLLGRVTYEGFAAAWPTMTSTGDFGERMNSIAKYVVSSTMDKAEWNNSTIIKGDIAAEFAMLKEQPGMDILVAGSADLLPLLMKNNLIDEYRFMIYPVVVGKGKRLFNDKGVKADLKLIDVTSLSSGIVILTYFSAKKEGEQRVSPT
jgi:dihydrofolate reductase